MRAMGEFFSVACAACWALAVVLFRRSGETLPAFELNLLKNLIGFGLMIPTVLLVRGWVGPGYGLEQWLIVLVSGVIGIAIADTWYLRALNLLGASRTGIVAMLFSPMVIMLSAFFLDERLLWLQWIGLILVLCGVGVVNWRPDRREISARALRQGLAWGSAAVGMMAIGIVSVKPVLADYDFLWTVTLRLAAGAGAMLLFLTLSRGWADSLAHYRSPQPWPLTLTASVLAGYVSMMMWMAGYWLTDASIASILNETAGVFIVLFAWLILKEALTWRKLAGLLICFVGVGLVAGVALLQ